MSVTQAPLGLSAPSNPDLPSAHVAHLLGEARTSPRADALLAAAGHIDPGATARWLVSEEGWARATLPGDRLAYVVRTVVQSHPGAGEAEPSRALVQCVSRYVDVVDPDAVLAAIDWSTQPDQGAELLAALADHFPSHPGVLRARVHLEIGSRPPAEIHPLLTRLGRIDPAAATLRYVLRLRDELGRVEATSVRAAILSSFTADTLVPYLDLECRELGLHPDIYVAPFNTWEREIAATDSGLYRIDPEIVFVAASLDDLVPGLDVERDPSALEAAGEVALERVLSSVRRLVERSDALVVVHGLYSVYPDPAGLLLGRSVRSQTAWAEALNQRLREAFAELGRAYLLDMAGCLLRRASGPIENPKLRHLGRIRLADSGHAALAREYAKYIAPLKGVTRKCVVVDLDNTLWGGVVGEDGPHGVRLGDTAPGSEFVEFQRYLKTLVQRGFLLAVASKNNPDDALAVIRHHDAMVLREVDFAAMRINWLAKPDNLRAIAADLGIGLDSLVFLDDNPNERALMRQLLPEVLTPELPGDPALYREFAQGLPQLQVLHLTDEDRSRGEQYRVRAERDAARGNSDSLERFLHGLDIRVDIREADESTLQRVHQLFHRTNQFNLTTRRYGLQELRAFASSPDWRLYVLGARDQFGDHGLVATALVGLSEETWYIDSLLLSCRVIGYGVETALLSYIADRAAEAGARFLEGEFRATAKNRPATDFYSRHAFQLVSEEKEGSRWRAELSDGAVLAPSWITLSTYET